jgi:hypothetical protein
VTLRFRSNTFIPILCRGVNSAFLSAARPTLCSLSQADSFVRVLLERLVPQSNLV